MKSKSSQRAQVGTVRPSQMMYTYGIGSIVDLPDISVIVMGLDEWPTDTEPIEEPRLLNAIHYRPQLRLNHVQQLRTLPRSTDADEAGNNSALGAPVAIFPRWWVCPKCRQLAPMSSGVFEQKALWNRNTVMLRHTGCPKSKQPPQVIPARILVACEDGHLDDFPWVTFVHRGGSCMHASSTLKLDEAGISGEVRDLEVRCSCGARRRLAEAFGRENRAQMPMCSGRRPHLRDYDDTPCRHHARAIALGASNLWFPIVLSVLSIPSDEGRLLQLIEENWAELKFVHNKDILNAMRQMGRVRGELADYNDDEILEGIKRVEAHEGAPTVDAADIKLPEYTIFREGDTARKNLDFQIRRLPLGGADWSALHITDVVLAERLREVQAMVGFARIDAVGELTDPDQQVAIHAAPLSRYQTDWLPATELRGEGLFIHFDEEAVAAWEAADALRDHDSAFREAHASWREKRGIKNPVDRFPGMRYVLLHSFSHALMRQLALEAGYSAASLKERIYARPSTAEGGPMAGVLIYTAAPDSEGTLGGLIGVGADERGLNHLVHEALRSMMLCASDPLCAERDVDAGGRTVHAAACHTCLFAPETSCERGNRYLDRSVLVPTIDAERAHYAFFKVDSL